MTHCKIGDNAFVVVGGSFPRCNTLVVIGDEVLVVDPGCSIEDLRRFLAEMEFSLSDVGTVVLSHIHPDHIVHAARIQRLSKCRIAANEITAPLFNNKERMKEFLGFHKANPVRPLWERLVNQKMYGALDDGRVDEILSDGDKFSNGGVTLRMLHTPGHTPDHMCVELLEQNLVFAADIDLTEFGPYYGHPNSSIGQFRNSIHILKERQYAGLVSGHLDEPLVVEYAQALDAYERQIDLREDLVLLAVQDGATSIPEITVNPIIYPSLTDPVYLQFETWMIEHHVESLEEKGMIEKRNNRFVPLES
jgi:glyoxylase-like metal-dependent hydrolase (beta-lactamase superfamily II)